jgi:hypothetical protein
MPFQRSDAAQGRAGVRRPLRLGCYDNRDVPSGFISNNVVSTLRNSSQLSSKISKIFSNVPEESA